MTEEKTTPQNFIRQHIDSDLRDGARTEIITRFPPEPNGYLHLGHAKAICLNFGVARDYNGRCNLRFDDTNPEKEEQEYIDAIKRDVSWLGFEWSSLHHASDYFDTLYGYAEALIEKGLAYVDSQSADEMRRNRGNLTDPGTDSPFRDRPVEENLDLLRRMKVGEFEDGAHVLRAKIDMASPNINMRDPALYRIRHIAHPRTGQQWCIYPTYDFTHGQSDAIEHVSHSLCTLEFEDHRPLYDWLIQNLPVPSQPRQIEFSRLEPLYTITSKRKLLELVNEGLVDGWDDPRMPTISGLRRRGYTPEAIRLFIERAGVSKAKNEVDPATLEGALREDLGDKARRVMAVLDPLKIVLTNYPEGQVESADSPYHQQKPELGSRELPFTRELYIERDDFMESPPNKKYKRLKPGGSVRLRFGYIIDFEEMIKDEQGNIVELRCTYDPETRSGHDESGRKVKGTIHWVSAEQCCDAQVRLYDRLFTIERPTGDKDRDFKAFINADSLTVVNVKLEQSLNSAQPGEHFQFERTGYFVVDTVDSQPGQPVFNRSVALRDSWAKQQ
nr:glutamine--tRNA ligase-like [Nerophis lumbriciformis]